MAKPVEVRRRIERILDETRQISRGLTRSRWAALLACSVPLVWLAAVIQPARVIAQQAAPSAISELQGKRQLDPADVSRLEQYLTTKPDDLSARQQLILHYYLAGVREPRLTHIMWLIANYPEAAVTALMSRGITPQATSLNDANDYARAAALWKQQAAAHSGDMRVLSNAADFFSQPGADYAEAERLLKAATVLEPGSRFVDRLAKLYAAAILGATGDPHYARSDAAFADHAKAELESTADLNLLLYAGGALTGAAQRPEAGKPLPPGVLNLDDHPLLVQAVDFGRHLMERRGTAPRAAILPPLPPASPGGADVRVVSKVDVPPSLSHKVEPSYPPLAAQARIQGDVHISVKVAADGTVARIEVMSGHPLLVPATLEAVRQWTFQPARLGGQAVESQTEITVPFRLDSATAAAAAQQRIAAPPGVSMITQASVTNTGHSAGVLTQVPPEYPPLAKQAGIQGDVKLAVTVGTDGKVSKAGAVSGHPLLVPSALEAVKQWQFSPGWQNGEPVESQTEVTMQFRLGDTAAQAPRGVLGGIISSVPAGGPPPPPPPPASAAGSNQWVRLVRVGGAVQAAKLETRVKPVYPDQARAAGIKGQVTLNVTIAEDGHVQKVEPVDGHPLLVAAAEDAVKQWVYKPTYLNGQPVVVLTTVTLPFPPDEN